MTQEAFCSYEPIQINEETLPIIAQVVENIPGGFFIYHADNDERIIHINTAMLRIFGCDTQEEFEQLTGNTFRGLVHPNDIDQVEESIWQQIASSNYDLDYVEYRIIQKDGTIRWIQDYGHFAHSDLYGDIFYVFIDDATDRLKKRMIELEEINLELRYTYEREKQYKKAILYDAVTFFEVNLYKNEFITTAAQVVNGQVHDLFHFLGIPCFTKYTEYVEYWSSHIEPEDRQMYKDFCDVDRLIACCESGELEQTCKSWVTDVFGRKRLYQYIFLLGKHEITGDVIALSLAKDETAHAEKQKMLQSALQQANVANVARNTFLANMSHDMRTPLNSIIGFTELLQAHPYDRQRLMDYTQKIRASSEQLLSIITESMELTRMESGKLALTEVECNIIDLITEVEKRILPEAHVKRITLMIDKSGITHFNLIADPTRIQEILSQLLDNAVKYTLPNGHVTLTVKEQSGIPGGYGKYQFIVADDGIGISENFLEKIFSPFSREYNTTASGVLGSGLGLVVVKSLIDIMLGTIDVQSVRGQGSTFTVTLAIKLRSEQLPYQQTLPPPIDEKALKGKRLLLVEDNAINMEIAKELLTGCGFLVETAENGQIAVDKLQADGPGKYDLILMDIQMPVMDGYEATKVIRNLPDPRLARIPIIAVSANAFAEDKSKSLAVGMNAHFSKPIDIARLKELIARILNCVS